MNVGEQIKKLRTSRNLTQLDIAERLQVTKSTISAYENGSRLPSYDVLIKIAQLFHVSTDNLLGYSNKYVIDVTGLTDKQRNTIQDVVTTYKQHNKLLNDVLGDGDSIHKDMVRLGLVKDDFDLG